MDDASPCVDLFYIHTAPLFSRSQGLAQDVRYYGKWMPGEAERRIGHLYPKAQLLDGQEARSAAGAIGTENNIATVVAWLWARTVRSPDPYTVVQSSGITCGAEGFGFSDRFGLAGRCACAGEAAVVADVAEADGLG